MPATDVEILAVDVQRLLRMALADWYSWLASKSVRKEDWRGVPGWCKQMPGRLDIPWAIHELPKHVGNGQMMRVLGDLIDHASMSCQSLEGVPSLEKLDSQTKLLLEVLDG